MKSWLKNCLLAVFMGVLLPMTVVGVWYQRKLPGEKTEIPTLTAPATEETEEIMTERERKITVLFGDGSQTEMGLDNYITGVVLAEMPVSFEPEAL